MCVFHIQLELSCSLTIYITEIFAVCVCVCLLLCYGTRSLLSGHVRTYVRLRVSCNPPPTPTHTPSRACCSLMRVQHLAAEAGGKEVKVVNGATQSVVLHARDGAKPLLAVTRTQYVRGLCACLCNSCCSVCFRAS